MAMTSSIPHWPHIKVTCLTKKEEKLKELENHCIIASDNAQLDHRDNLGSQKADSVGFGYPQNFTQLCIATRSTYKDSWESPA